MALTRQRIVDVAYSTLRERGLAGVSMRRLAQDLGVAPGALYYHIASKQELLAAVAERILADATHATSATDPAQAACDIREALLRVRDSAEVISFVHAYRPEALTPFHALEQIFSARLPADRARHAAQTLISYTLGFVAEEQNYAELVRAGIASDEPAAQYTVDGYHFGIETIIRGLQD